MAFFLGHIYTARFPTENLNGLKVALYGSVTSDEIEAEGGVAVPIAAVEIYTALQTGILDFVAAGNSRELRVLDRLFGGELIYQEYDAAPLPTGPTEGSDALTGTDAVDDIDLLGGDDSFDGLGGADLIRGGAGNDAIDGDVGNDRIWGGSGYDTLRGEGGRDRLFGGAAGDSLYGGAKSDILKGGGGADMLYGQAGDDTLVGAAGWDFLYGGGGNDDLSGGKGLDYLYGGAGADVLSGGATDDELYGEGGADTLAGDAGNDVLAGGDGNDTLDGGAGWDILRGGRGNDVMTGGRGSDTFQFETFGERNHDTITDFRKGFDTIELSDADYVIRKAAEGLILRFGGGESLLLEGVFGRQGVIDSIDLRLRREVGDLDEMQGHGATFGYDDTVM